MTKSIVRTMDVQTVIDILLAMFAPKTTWAEATTNRLIETIDEFQQFAIVQTVTQWIDEILTMFTGRGDEHWHR